MARTTTARWTLPLTALLLVNTVLVALAYRQVGLTPELIAAPDAPVANEQPPVGDESASTEPQAVAIAEPTNVEGGSPATQDARGATNVSAAHDYYWDPAEVAAAGDNAADALATRGEVRVAPASPPDDHDIVADPLVSNPPRQPATESLVGATSAPGTTNAEQPPGQLVFLIFVNPLGSGGMVHFLLDGEVVSLNAGEFYRLPVADECLVQFHRGDAFGDAEHRCQFGVYAFAVGDAGWTLSEANGSLAVRLLKTCRPVAVRNELDND